MGGCPSRGSEGAGAGWDPSAQPRAPRSGCGTKGVDLLTGDGLHVPGPPASGLGGPPTGRPVPAPEGLWRPQPPPTPAPSGPRASLRGTGTARARGRGAEGRTTLGLGQVAPTCLLFGLPAYLKGRVYLLESRRLLFLLHGTLILQTRSDGLP